jgi:hypothetical protein
MKQYLSYLATAVFLFATAAFASAACVQGDNGSTTQSFTLFAGQTINSGNVSATVVRPGKATPFLVNSLMFPVTLPLQQHTP